MIPRDPSTFKGQKILSDGAALTRAIAESEAEHISATQSEAFIWASTFATGGTDIEALTIQNDHATKALIIQKIWVAAADAAVYTVGNVTSGTPAGTTVTPTCLNREQVKTAQATAFGNAAVTGSVVVGNLWTIPVLADAPPFDIETEGAILLGKDDIFGISCSASTTVYLSILGYFADPMDL